VSVRKRVGPLSAAVWMVCSMAAWGQNAAPADRAASRTAMDRQEIRAQLMPRRYTTVAAEIGAKINKIAVQEGAAFRAGQVLVGFDCSLQQAQLQKAQAELEAAEQTLKSNVRLAELNSVGQLELDLSRAAVNRSKAELSANQVVLDKCVITAPFAGRIAEQKAREQQFVQPGQALLDILDDSVLELEFLVPSSWLAWLKVGGAFEVEIDETRKKYPARFIRKGARVDPVSQSIKVTGAIDGRFPELMTGMSGRVRVTPPAQ
jgi:membrane fusion protein, multidrug efflux system